MTRYQWWLIVFIAVGLVGMHHLVDAPTAQTTMASATPIQHAGAEPAGINPVEATSTSVVVSQTDCCDPMDMAGHFCLAVLIAITALVASLIFAGAWHRLREPGRLLAAVIALGARGPPLGCLPHTQLCVLRR